ncbi:FkbM family methyltransferase [Streptomyces sp. AM 3-1-1]|uniref:FkbM family methyltransferase n=1 Tax=Streptomyces sp. AM 3-1-1 TaxID=3028711 RepID=UPI0023BA029A|nr:FkbM family methyltransferase [Streptomyces sp. AM 3-1-1]WEH28533.1 FkbM family methyltransferase [Streptomyces sp. AM 3-1-1]
MRHAPGITGKPGVVDSYLNSVLCTVPRRCQCRTRVGTRFNVDTRDLIQRYIYMFGMWEPNLTKWLSSRLKPGNVFVDVGANIGYFSALGARLVGAGGAVVSVEASPTFAELLRANLRLNRADNVRVVEQAVSDREETLTLVLASSANMGANSIVPYDGPIEARHEVPASPLASLLTEDEVRRARVIKIDVEGAEGKAVRGLAPLLGKLRPDAEVTVEVTPSRMTELGDTAAELLGTMAAAGFHPYRLPNDYSPGSYPAAIRAPLPPLRRLRGEVTGESDLVFSRVDADVLP